MTALKGGLIYTYCTIWNVSDESNTGLLEICLMNYANGRKCSVKRSSLLDANCLHTIVIHYHGLLPAMVSVTAMLLPFERITKTR